MQFAVLGAHPTLSIAELAAISGSGFSITSAGNDAVIGEFGRPGKELVDRLGGTIKAGQVLKSFNGDDTEGIAKCIADEAGRSGEGKIVFGISLHDAGNPDRVRRSKNDLLKLSLTVKRLLKDTGRPVRAVTSKESSLSSVIIRTNGLLKSGGEFVLMATPEGFTVGKTEAVQDFGAWSDRDFGRPSRDARSGMLPPKLARLMINLTGAEPAGGTLLDPFCGSGTVLMEGALMGFATVIGGDISDKAVSDTGRNMNWLRDQSPTTRTTRVSVFHTPAQEIEKFVTAPVDAVATETFLGPPLRGNEARFTLERNTKSLLEMYAPAFAAITRVMKPGTKMVVAFPAFRSGPDLIYVPVRSMLEQAGLAVVPALPGGLHPSLVKQTPSGALLYEREGQKVAREIFVLRKI